MKNLKFYKVVLILIILLNVITYVSAEIIPICSDPSGQYLPASVKSKFNDKDDGIIICWADNRNNGSLYVQKIDLKGKIKWTKDGILLDSELGGGFTSDADYPQIFPDNSGGAVIIYTKTFLAAKEIYAQKVYYNGGYLGRPVCLSSYYGGFNYAPSAVLTKNNEITVTWENFYDGDFNIHAQKIDLNANKLWNNGVEVMVCDYLFDQRKPTIAYDESNYTFITWLDSRNSGNYNEFAYDLYANRLDSNGNYIKYGSKGKFIFSYNNRSELNIKTDSHSKNEKIYFDRNDPKVNIEKEIFYNHNLVASNNNSFIVSVEKWINFRDSFIKVLKVNENLDIVWSNVIDADSYQIKPLIISDNNYGACVFWNDSRNNENGIYGIGINKSGNIIWGEEKGIKISCDNMKSSSRRVLPSEKNQNGINSEQNKIFLTWVTSEINKLFLSNLNLADQSNCGSSLLIQDNINEGEYTSIITQRNNVVVVFKQLNNIFASITEMTGNNLIEPNKKIIINNFPNPFNPTTEIGFSISNDGLVNLNVYDIVGRVVKTLVNEFKGAGNYSVTFDGSNLTTGVYFYRIEVNGLIQTKKMTLIK